ncbi:hypothetical protein BDZ89DRAFT_1072788 [Hymenopellis radicata]|nr:hypothetical protein BDZ89DRAFT_1072788 [Hymenopellis radicata]
MDHTLLERYSSSSDWFESLLSTPTRTRQSRLDTSDAIPAFYPFAARQSGDQNMFPLDNDSQVFPRINGESENPPLQYGEYTFQPQKEQIMSEQAHFTSSSGGAPYSQYLSIQNQAATSVDLSYDNLSSLPIVGVEMPSSFNFSTSSPYGFGQTRHDARPYAPEPRHDPNVGRLPGANNSFPPHAAPVSEIQTQLRHPRARGRAQAVIQRRRTGPASYNCSACGPAVDFTTAAALKTHIESSHLGRVFLCEKCPKTFAHPSSRARHQRKCTGNASLLII